MGLSENEVSESRNKYGSNKLSKGKRRTFKTLLLESLGDPIIKILLIALVIKIVFLFKTYDWFETIGILVAVLLATLISSLSEYGSESAFKKLEADNENIDVKVKRNNKIIEININELVVGDNVILQSGDKVPADGYLLDGNLSVDESMLNGESKESKKVPISDKININSNSKIYRGTVVYSGNANMLVNKVGDNTLYGSISKELQEKNPDSPLKIRLKGLAKIISKIGYIGAFLVTFSYLFSNIVINNNFDKTLILNTLTNFEEIAEYLIYALTLGVTIIVVAVPEGLPMMITLVLSSNMKKMLKDNVLVRKMVGIETAGNLNLLLTDKTGTLTKGKLNVTNIILPDNTKIKDFKELKNYSNIINLYYCALSLNNESIISENNIIGGNSTDKSLKEYTKDYNLKIPIISKTAFTSTNKSSEVTVSYKGVKTFIKGAYEKVVVNCNHIINCKGEIIPFTNKDFIIKLIERNSSLGSRIIAIAMKENDKTIFLGHVLIKDELRKESKTGINLLKKAGIDVIMITGDNHKTAKVIAKEVGIITSNKHIVLTSEEFNKSSDEDIIRKLPNIKVISRAVPKDKSRLVKIAQSINLVVGMTGDGVNDAPALKKANVGFAMGSGTEVAKEAGDIVILDDNILSISKAVLYGRTIFKSIRKFIIYQLSINACALIISIVGSLIGISEPITILQMLWLNMIMDTFAGMAFSYEYPLEEYMEEKPKRISEPIINKYMYSEIILSGLYTSIICILFLKLPIVKEIFRVGTDNIYLYTAYFALFIFLGIFNAFNARTSRINLLANIKRNKVFLIIFSFIIIMQIYIIYFGSDLFRTYGLTLTELIIVLILSLTIIPLDIIRKVILKRKGIKFSI